MRASHSRRFAARIAALEAELRELKAEMAQAEVEQRVTAGIIRETAIEFGRTTQEILGRGRRREVVRARMVAMYLARELTGATTPEIGAIFDRDHSTVCSAHARVTKLVSSSPEIAISVQRLRRRLAAGNDPAGSPGCARP